jgi:SSS family solute:Na+ symporter
MNGLRIANPDAVVVVGYFVLTIAFGIWSGRKKIRSAEQLFLANREAAWPLVGTSLFAANISSQQFVGQAGLAFSIGLAAGAFQLVGALCFTLLAVFFVDVYLGLKLSTAPEFFERRFGTGSRLFVAGINVVMILAANLTAALYAGATVLTDLLGWTLTHQFLIATILIAVSAGTCAIFGGLRSVLWFDLVQAIVLVFGGVLTLVCTVGKAGGLSGLATLHDAGGTSLWSVIQPWSHPFGWLPLATGAVILGVHGHCTDHDYVQRALAAKNLFHSKMGALFAAFLKILALFIIAAPGVVAAKLLPASTPPDRVYAQLVTGFVPVGLTGLVLAGLLAAILGSMASGLSAVSSLLTFDFLLKARPTMAEERRVMFGRLIMGAVLLICVVCAPLIGRYQGLYPYLIRVWSLLAPPVFVCVVAGVFTQRASNLAAVITLATGFTLGLIAFIILDRPACVAALPVYLRSALNCGFVITLICAGVMAAFSLPSRIGPGQSTSSRDVRHTEPMSRREQRIYHATLAMLTIVWLAVILLFSPWGIARTVPPTTRSTASPPVISRAP